MIKWKLSAWKSILALVEKTWWHRRTHICINMYNLTAVKTFTCTHIRLGWFYRQWQTDGIHSWSNQFHNGQGSHFIFDWQQLLHFLFCDINHRYFFCWKYKLTVFLASFLKTFSCRLISLAVAPRRCIASVLSASLRVRLSSVSSAASWCSQQTYL